MEKTEGDKPYVIRREDDTVVFRVSRSDERFAKDLLSNLNDGVTAADGDLAVSA